MIYLWLTLLLSPWLLRRIPPIEGAPRSVLLIQTAKIGDFVCTTPLVREIRREWPHAELHLLIHRINQPLARHNPYGARVHMLPVGGLKGLSGRLWLWHLLRDQGIDATICVSPNLTQWLAPLWAGVSLRASVVPNLGGSSYRAARRFLTHSEAHRAGRLLIETEFALLRRIGLAPKASTKEAWLSPDAEIVAERLLEGFRRPLVGIGVSAGNKMKELGEAKLLELARALLLRSSATLVLVGGPDERELAARVQQTLHVEGHGGRVLDAAGKLDLAQLPAMLVRFRAYVGVDSGITYLADAVGTPVVDLMGPADANDQRPTGPRAVVLRSTVPCAPCSHAFSAPYACSIGTRDCVAAVEPEVLVQPVLKLLAKP